ncbi:DUF3944 domain-containing protein [Volucribacter amazonae]|uniref:DUF3944 domain-containing protein n=1 Tax=Volucribacter amazonae TaxID=256731 RepID=A0A9X4PBX7_9PAST|nr:DUF3944 domain-containing protein [Volucribacter amazonae]MDG6894721.1 hypothetical protein [Volucribacter amazonae]
MEYRYDPDLEFLATCDANELDDLVKTLIYDSDNTKRLTEELSSNHKYKKYRPNHNKYWEEIAAEIQTFGGNSIMNLFRGKGVCYREILCDVCDKLKVPYNDNSSTKLIEENLLMKILEKAIYEMSTEQLKQLSIQLDLKNTNNLSSQATTAALLTIFKMGGFKSYQLTVIIANAVLKALIGRGLTIGGNILLTRTAAILTGPIGWAITGIWTAFDIAGPAYRVTIPVVIQIAFLRHLKTHSEAIRATESFTL